LPRNTATYVPPSIGNMLRTAAPAKTHGTILALISDCRMRLGPFAALFLAQAKFKRTEPRIGRAFMTTNAVIHHETVQVATSGATLIGDLTVPPAAAGLVLFAHGSGSGRFSPRNRFVAEHLQTAGLATLLIDLLTEKEEAIDDRTGHLRFDIGLLAARLVGAAEWLSRDPHTRHLPIGCFGASTGGGAALVAAARQPEQIRVVVSRGGRPDLAGEALPAVRAPTLLIVGAWDEPVIGMNRTALARLGAETKKLVIVPRATHLFEEPGALEQVADLASDWFTRYLPLEAEATAG
jgi:putative phosphoribosyl transferase